MEKNTAADPAGAVAKGKPIPVNVDNFIRAETDMYFGKTVEDGGFGKLRHRRQMAEIDKQGIVRMNRDTIYSSGVFDLEAAPLTLTFVVFTSDNGPEATWPWQGSSGPWRGYYFTHMEGSLRTPFIIRWPERIPASRVSNEIVHEVDTFTTFAKIAGASAPQDRPIDGVDQTDFLLGKSDKSSREGFPVFVADRLEAIKWKNWKIVFYDEQRDWWTEPGKLGSPKAFDLIPDPKEEYPQTGLRSSWIAGPAMKIVVEFEQSLKKHPQIAPGTPDPYTPPNQ